MMMPAAAGSQPRQPRVTADGRNFRFVWFVVTGSALFAAVLRPTTGGRDSLRRTYRHSALAAVTTANTNSVAARWKPHPHRTSMAEARTPPTPAMDIDTGTASAMICSGRCWPVAATMRAPGTYSTAAIAASIGSTSIQESSCTIPSFPSGFISSAVQRFRRPSLERIFCMFEHTSAGHYLSVSRYRKSVITQCSQCMISGSANLRGNQAVDRADTNIAQELWTSDESIAPELLL